MKKEASIKKREIFRKELTSFQLELRKHLTAFITGAFAFVAALFWRDAIRDMIDVFIPVTESWAYRFYTAILVTIIAVVAIVIISRLLRVGKIK